jgi:hypothetical protein
MRLSLVLAGSAWIGLFIAGQAFGRPSAEFCELNPESPLCGGIEEPPVDPDPCDANPSLCPPEVDPVEVEPEPELPSVEMAGGGRFKGPGFNRPVEATGSLSYDESTFSLFSNLDCEAAAGTVVAKGPSGKKHQLFLDDASLDAYAESLARSARLLTGAGGAPVGKTSKLVLKENADGTLSLKIKIQVVVEDLGEVVYKANLATIDPAATPQTARVLCR